MPKRPQSEPTSVSEAVMAGFEKGMRVDDGLVEVVVVGPQEVDGQTAGAVLRMPAIEAWRLNQGGHVRLSERGKALTDKAQADRFEQLLVGD